MSNGYADVSVAKVKIAVNNYQKECKALEDYIKDCAEKYYKDNIHKLKAVKFFGVTLRKERSKVQLLGNGVISIFRKDSLIDTLIKRKYLKFTTADGILKDRIHFVSHTIVDGYYIVLLWGDMVKILSNLIKVTTEDTVFVNDQLSEFINVFYEEPSS